jgi:molybdopterin-containing oxidoreductase family iron-sulfur binding subunit
MPSYRHIAIHALSAPPDPGRRRALVLMAASAALAGAGCSGPPQEQILPYVRMPELSAAGQPVFYATALVRGGYAHGVLVETNMGRPTKVEGNPHHPASLGATDAITQASILQLWDPDRSQLVMRGDAVSDWAALQLALAPRRAAWAADGGAGLRILTGSVSSPTLTAQMAQLLARFPRARWIQYDPQHDDAAIEAAQLAFGHGVDVVARPQAARTVLCFDADPLGQGAAAVAFARAFVRDRNSVSPRFTRRLYVIESCPTLTGAAADNRLALAPAQIGHLLARVGGRFGVCDAPAMDAASNADAAQLALWESALAGALKRDRGASLVMTGGALGPAARAIAHGLNVKLGNVGATALPIAPVVAPAQAQRPALAALVDEMRAGVVDTLVMLETNPVYDAPGVLAFGAALRQVPCSLHLGLYRDETARASSWHVPAAHAYEHWSDARAFDGTASIVQPLIAPLYGGRSVHAVLAWLNGEDGIDGRVLVQRTWRRLRGDAGFDRFWTDALRRGVIEGSASPPLALAAFRKLALPAAGPATAAAVSSSATLPAWFRADPAIGAGEFANNGWLQELPHPLTGLCWDNAVLLGPATAQAMALRSGDVVRLAVPDGGAALEAPVWIMAGHAEQCLTLPLGYGRRAAGRVGDGVGFDAYRLMPLAGPVLLNVSPAGRRHTFASPQQHTQMAGRARARSGSLAAFTRDPQFATAAERASAPPGSLYPAVAYPGYKWGMAIDLNACIGCGACTLACQAENNIPIVGKDEVGRGRIMHWIRVDRYEQGEGASWRGIFQPVPCMHCEDAPCELVCPVGATMHDSEGVNVQVYNRCVGTRFCSNNCPYKVRRFNFLHYGRDLPADAAQRNPQVTVRWRGVMEKCNYCLQRITRARLDAEQLGRPLRDGEVVSACQAACPTAAIVFGDLNNPGSAVNRAKASPLDYVLLSELNTRPRTSYAARVRNADPALE